MASDQMHFRRRIQELSDTSYQQARYVFTDFLTEAEYADVLAGGNYACGMEASGGHENAERRMVRFGSEELCGYEAAFPITIIRIAPLIEKFSDTFTHRDYLGAVLNLGIDRKVTGDILTDGTYGFLFCEDKITDFILENLTKVKHTHVKCSVAETVPDNLKSEIVPKEIQVDSLRLDAMISHAFGISRTETTECFRLQHVFVNGRLMENKTHQPENGDLISVRGYGRFRYEGVTRMTRKGKHNVLLSCYR